MIGASVNRVIREGAWYVLPSNRGVAQGVYRGGGETLTFTIRYPDPSASHANFPFKVVVTVEVAVDVGVTCPVVDRADPRSNAVYHATTRQGYI
jgi:hypothetical protein